MATLKDYYLLCRSISLYQTNERYFQQSGFLKLVLVSTSTNNTQYPAWKVLMARRPLRGFGVACALCWPFLVLVADVLGLLGWCRMRCSRARGEFV